VNVDITIKSKTPTYGGSISENDLKVLRDLIKKIPADHWDNYRAQMLLAYTQEKVKDDAGKVIEYMGETKYQNTRFSLQQRNQINQLICRYP